MAERPNEAAAAQQRRDCIQIATGILMERYDVPGQTAERALMDWSRVTGIGVHQLASMVVSDAADRRRMDL